ncbi:ESF1 homolog [Tribolium castaneum]|uniref:ESF1 homolog-like Protein n=1 Tax=Tribolium castaneum TaxID=7070 RepID=D1ZZY9_TRICA|nr:PREDICTED: ESF1 homolog [Tribolium castaneum]EFA01774.1 ESF1 homolog-like Protein [Tribolium castaneum]|eukprot:XP_975330.1 PREDICTED: ESF1 homolog [Tribolium castaneum]
MEDKRFAHIKTDPKFRRIPKGARKVKIDKRFQSMFKDKKFKVKYTVDKRGRPVNHTSTEDLKRYYELSSSESSSDEEPEEPGKYVKAPQNDLNVKDKSDKELPSDVKKKLRDLNVDYARGEGNLLSESSSDDEETDEEVSEGEQIEHKWGELDNDADRTDEATYRLAACNLDWDRIRAVDLMVLFNSFLPPGGAVKSVVIYPSEFGKERMKEEEVKGPIELVEHKEIEEEDTEEGSKYHMEKLRQYQLNRLKYYYAVVTFDGANTANKVYTECDGMEYESSATKLDLRFIPDDMTFDDEPKEQCDKLPELNKYQPRFFTTTALQQAKVDLTWDETDPDRIEMTQKLNTGKIEEIPEHELQNFVAVSDEESEDEEKNATSDDDESTNNPIDKYKQLLQEIEEKEQEKKNREVEMEVSWGIDLKDKTEKLVKKKIENEEEKTPFQKYLDKRKEKRKEKKKKKRENEDSDDVPSDIDMNDPYFAEEFNNPEFKKKKVKEKKSQSEEENNPELELLLADEDDDNKKHFSLKKIQKQEEATSKKKRKLKETDEKDDFQVDVNDDRFSALFTSHLYNIDPTDPHYKKTKGMERLINEKIKRRKDDSEREMTEKPMKKDAELSVLVKSVKRKAEALSNKKK